MSDRVKSAELEFKGVRCAVSSLSPAGITELKRGSDWKEECAENIWRLAPGANGAHEIGI
jgi:hypothetical protein